MREIFFIAQYWTILLNLWKFDLNRLPLINSLLLPLYLVLELNLELFNNSPRRRYPCATRRYLRKMWICCIPLWEDVFTKEFPHIPPPPWCSLPQVLNPPQPASLIVFRRGCKAGKKLRHPGWHFLLTLGKHKMLYTNNKSLCAYVA